MRMPRHSRVTAWHRGWLARSPICTRRSRPVTSTESATITPDSWATRRGHSISRSNTFSLVNHSSTDMKGMTMNALQNTLPLIGRLLLAYIFIMAGFSKIGGFDGTVGYIQSVGLPMPTIAALAAIAVELGGGLLLAVGYKARWAAAALAIFSVITAIAVELGGGLLLAVGNKTQKTTTTQTIFSVITAMAFHNYWAVPAEQVQMQSIQFMKNLAIAGGLLYVVVYGSGAYALERVTARNTRVGERATV